MRKRRAVASDDETIPCVQGRIVPQVDNVDLITLVRYPNKGVSGIGFDWLGDPQNRTHAEVHFEPIDGSHGGDGSHVDRRIADDESDFSKGDSGPPRRWNL